MTYHKRYSLIIFIPINDIAKRAIFSSLSVLQQTPPDYSGCCISATRERKSHIITGSTGATHLRIPVGNNVTSVLSIVLHVVPRKTDTPLWLRKSRNNLPLPFSFTHSLSPPLSLSLCPPPARSFSRNVRSRFHGGRRMPESRCFVQELANAAVIATACNENRAKTRKDQLSAALQRANDTHMTPTSPCDTVRAHNTPEININVRQTWTLPAFIYAILIVY